MDREPEELQYLGAVGIVRESYKILRSCFKLLGLLTLTLVLPLSFVILAHGFLTERLFNKIHVEWGKVLLIELSYVAFVLAFSLLSTSAVVYTMACLYTGKKLSYATVISVMPRVWKRLMINFLWLFAYNVVFFLWILFGVVDKLRSGVLLFGVVLISMVWQLASMVWQLASMVSVVEEKYGLEAMKKSRDLIKGKRGTALALNISCLITAGSIAQSFEMTVVHGGRRNIGVWERTAIGALLLALECVVNLMWMLTQSVFYFVCEAHHHQSIDKSALSDHLEGYLKEYMPLKDSINAIQSENLDP